ncbi:hypothetical protein [Celeribacter sp.]|uniref:hypothetical protein n=1 Tax=Celeribacter sp. TaxID=1890673 RepID=UPI003A8F77DC
MSDASIATDFIRSQVVAWSKIARHPTGYGYRVTRSRPVCAGMDGVEVAVAFAGYISLLVSVGLWGLPGSLMVANIVGFKIVLTLVFAMVGLSLVYAARRGLKRELHVDRRRRQLRVVWRNRKDDTRLDTVIGFNEVGSLFLRRSVWTCGRTQLFVRVDMVKTPIHIFSGSGREMQGLWNALNANLQAAATPKTMQSTLFSVMPEQQARVVQRNGGPARAMASTTGRGVVAAAELTHRAIL